MNTQLPELGTHLNLDAEYLYSIEHARGLIIAFFEHYDRICIQNIRLVTNEDTPNDNQNARR